MIILKIIAILCGILLLFWGVWASFEGKKPYDKIGAVVAPIGLIMSLIGVLLLCVPGFFSN